MEWIKINHNCLVNALIDMPTESEAEEARSVVDAEIESYYDYVKKEAGNDFEISVDHDSAEWGSSYVAESSKGDDFMTYEVKGFWEWCN